MTINLCAYSELTLSRMQDIFTEYNTATETKSININLINLKDKINNEVNLTSGFDILFFKK